MTKKDEKITQKDTTSQRTPQDSTLHSADSAAESELLTGGGLGGDAELRPDRLGARLRPDRLGARLRPDRLGVLAREVPAWRLTDDNALLRTWSHPNPLTAACFALYVATLAEASGKPTVIRQYQGRVTVRISSPETGGLTEEDFQLAHQLGAHA